MNRINLINMDEEKWLTVLRQECEEKSQRIVAGELNVSTAMISQALNGIYKGDIKKLERRVRGAYMGDTVMCPVLNELAVNKCLQNQRRKVSLHNPLRLALYKACNGNCVNADHNQEKSA
ncbi:MAG: transcriptional regulator [Oleibacter sp.]|nr:transcriptional regulator [Thalassolituus sp.]|tara:strand:- start:628 stop:987 length:360 start_codon:yes stop_codon:yes gene_type:complete